jgi:hypothetical protein
VRVLVAFAAAIGLCGCSNAASPPAAPVTTAATPAPTPQPTANPLSTTCDRLGLVDGHADCSAPASATFGDSINDAIETVRAEHPEYFDGNNVLDVGGYYVGVIRALDRWGICGYTRDGEEVGVKSGNDYSEQWDVLTAQNRVRKAYLYTCSPAGFPVDPTPAPYPRPPGCSLPSSYYVACGRPESRYFDDVSGAVEQIQSDRPELFDFNDRATGNGPRALDPGAYQNGVVAILRNRGYCAIFDGEEITIKRTNEFTEHFDINFADVYVRLGEGIYRAACYPAAF